jgi:hypothetical protein
VFFETVAELIPFVDKSVHFIGDVTAVHSVGGVQLNYVGNPSESERRRRPIMR